MDLTFDTAAVGQALREARERKGLTGRGLARQLNMDHADLYRIERGRTTTLARYAEIAAALGLRMKIRVQRAA